MIETVLDDLERHLKLPLTWLLVLLIFAAIAWVFDFPSANFVLNIVQIGLTVMWLIAAKGVHRENRDRLDRILAASEVARLELLRIREEDQAIKDAGGKP